MEIEYEAQTEDDTVEEIEDVMVHKIDTISEIEVEHTHTTAYTLREIDAKIIALQSQIVSKTAPLESQIVALQAIREGVLIEAGTVDLIEE